MNCDDYLALLATLPVDELAHGRAREHAATCRDCDRVTRVVAERERIMLMAFEDLRFSAPAVQTAERALAASGRRRVALYYQVGLGLALAATVFFVLINRAQDVASLGARVTETFRLQCLAPDQAAELLRPFIPATGHISFTPESPLGVIRVEASPEEMATARSLLARLDNPKQSQCRVRVKVPGVP